MPNKIDSNITAMYIAEELSLKTLPGSPVWYGREPNSYSDLGGEIKTVAREPIDPARQRKRGTTVDLDAGGGINEDLTQNNFTRLMQGFTFGDAREHDSTQPLNGTQIPLTSCTSTTYVAASGLGIFSANDLVLASGFGVAANNGLKLLSAATATTLTTTGNATEASPPAAAKVENVGFQFTSGDAVMTVASGVATLSTTTKDLTQLLLNVGEWVFIGGDLAAEKFATCPVGYARVASISTNAIVFDKVTAAFVSDTGTGKTIRMFFGKFLRNEKTPSLIKTRSYQIERQLGNDGSGIQSEYLEGSIANEMTINIPQADKANIDLSFVSLNNTTRTGAVGVKSGTRVSALGEKAINTTNDVYRMKMNIINPTTLQPSPLYAYLTKANISINNNAKVNKAIGVLGGFDITVGNFEVGGEFTAYFGDTAAVQSVRDNADVTFDIILAKSNAGQIFDIPLSGLGGGRVNVEKDQPITLDLESMAAEGAAGFTLGYTNFMYLPTSAMPVAQ